MRETPLTRLRAGGATPAAWRRDPSEGGDFGEALGAGVVALLSERPLVPEPFDSARPRLATSGEIGHLFRGGRVWVWGSGCARRPGAARVMEGDRILATRGPISGALLGGGRLRTDVFGDPIALLPRFHRPDRPKRRRLGVVPAPGDAAGRGLRFLSVDPALRETVAIISADPVASVEALSARVAAILECERVLAAAPAALILADAFGVPCLPFVPGPKAGLATEAVAADAPLDLGLLDALMGAGRFRTPVYRQPWNAPTDWDAAIAAIDEAWAPLETDVDALAACFPLDPGPPAQPLGATVWEHPALVSLGAPLAGSGQSGAAEASSREALAARLRRWRVPATTAPPRRPRPLTLAAAAEGPALRLSWARGDPESGHVNLGDALSPVIVGAIAGLPVTHAAFDSAAERLAAVGTIAHGLRNGVAHIWGAGLDEKINPLDSGAPWRRPPETGFEIHATRGPWTTEALRREGADAPGIFGDPVYFLDRIFPLGAVEKTHDLGVILHLSEVEAWRPGGTPEIREALRRYGVPDAFRDRVRLMDTRVAPSYRAIEARLREIAACRAILSTSLHGLVIADVYGVPNAWFGFADIGLARIDPMDRSQPVDHRVRDLYAGQGLSRASIIGTRRDQPSDWDRLIGLSTELEARRPDARPLFDAFPGPRVVRFEDQFWAPPPLERIGRL